MTDPEEVAKLRKAMLQYNAMKKDVIATLSEQTGLSSEELRHLVALLWPRGSV